MILIFVSDARMTLVVGCMILVATVLSPLLWHLWIHAGSANANFYFAMSVVYGIPQVCVICYVMRWVILTHTQHAHTNTYTHTTHTHIT